MRVAMTSIGRLVPHTESWEIYYGCNGYFAKFSRWPRSRDEVAEGLKYLRSDPKYILSIKEMMFSESDGNLLINYTSASGHKELVIKGKPQYSPNN